MLAVIVCFFIGLAVVLIAEYFHKKQKIVTETTRKIIHVVHGVCIIALALLTYWSVLVAAEAIFFVMAIVARKLKLFKSQHAVGRISWGEFFFPVGVIAIVLIGVPRWVFVLAVLHLAFADAAAALVGTRYGKNNSYRVFGQKKSIAGTAAFFAISALLVSLTVLLAPNSVTGVQSQAIYLLPWITTFAENIGAYGSDNLLILLAVALVLG